MTWHVAKILTPTTVQHTANTLLHMRHMLALTLPPVVQCTLAHPSTADWPVPNQVVIRCYATTVRTNTQAHDLLGLV